MLADRRTLVRSLLVPALTFDIGAKIWWPWTLAATVDRRARRHAETEPEAAAGS